MTPGTAATPHGPAVQPPTLAEIIAPSVVNPLERNVVINPAHRDFDRILPGSIRPFVFDRRLAGE